MNDLYEDYVSALGEKEALESKIAGMKTQITHDITENNNGEMIENEFGSFYLRGSVSTEYSDEVVELEKEAKKKIKEFSSIEMQPVKDLKDQEVSDGTAKVTETKIMNYKPVVTNN